MSGICGIICYNDKLVSHEDLNVLNIAQINYGGDGAKTWVSHMIGFGHQMSWLTYESIKEILPFHDEVRQIAITADIRLFNRNELCSKLNLQNTINLSDSEIVVEAYFKYGKSFVKHLLGEFSIAMWDGKLRELLLITDHSNNSHIFYYQDSNCLIFASSINALNQLSIIGRKINFSKIALLDYGLNSKYPGETYFSNINFITPGTMMAISSTGIINSDYY